jgi:hypothetical protein
MADIPVSTGSTVLGLVPGLQQHLGGGAGLMYVLGDPNGRVNPFQPTSSPSGACIAFDSANNQFYANTTGSTWVKLGSVE